MAEILRHPFPRELSAKKKRGARRHFFLAFESESSGRRNAVWISEARKTTMRRQRGFSLIELLIVVAIILVIAAIAIPSLLRAKIAANESSAVSSIRSIYTAEVSFQTSLPQTGYAANLLSLGPGAGNTTCPAAGPSIANACLLDAVLANGSKDGYGFESLGQVPVNGAFAAFTTVAVPISYNATGTRDFCTFEDNVMRQNPPNVANTGGAPTAAALAAGGGWAVCTVAPWTTM
jgi:prepilin-type N-terminal cleavage/methylation domain-containing protein